MGFVAGTIRNLLNGVSQQPPDIRLPTQVDEQVNGHATIAKGLRKRPPSIHRALIDGYNTSAVAFHTIVRDEVERYKVCFRFGGLQVIDLMDGTVQTLNTPNGTGYLSTSDPQRDIRAVTVADYTFIVNRSVTVAASPSLSPARPKEALIHVAASAYAKDYKVYINGGLAAHYLTPPGSGSNLDEQQIQTQTMNIAAALCGELTAPFGTLSIPLTGYGGVQVETFDATLTGPTWTVTRYDNVIHIVNNVGADFTVATEADGEKTHLRAHKDTESDFADLPEKGPQGFVIKIIGSKSTVNDDYYVQFDRAGGSVTKGVWKETVRPNTAINFNYSTMPHALVRESNGEFTFRQIAYDARACGDLVTTQWPSFFGKKINAIVFYRNRLGFTCGENVALSRDGKFYNFFRETATAVLDTDPIDIAVSHVKAATILHAVPFNESLLLCSAETQFRLDGGELFTPKTANAPLFSEFAMSPQVPPVVSGLSLYFATEGTQATTFTELQVGGPNEPPVPFGITDHCPHYVPTGIKKIAVSDKLKMVAGLSSSATDRVYLYKHFSSGQERLQSCWSYWQFDGAEVLDVDLIDNDMYLTLDRDGDICIEVIHCDEAFRDLDPELTIHLDRRLDSDDLTKTYDAGTNLTTYTLPFEVDEVMVVDAPGGVTSATGRNYPVIDIVGNLVKVAGNKTAEKVFIGVPYQFYVRLSKVVARERDETPMIGGELTVSQMIFRVMTGFLRATVTQLYRDAYSVDATGAVLGDPRNIIGQPSTVWGDLRVPIMAKADEIEIELVSDSYLPCAILNASWSGDFDRNGFFPL